MSTLTNAAFDAHLWRYRHLPYAEIADMLGVTLEELTHRARKQGWRRRPGRDSAVTHAPCAECGKARVPRLKLNADRICPTCRRAMLPKATPDPNRALYLRELKRVQQKRKRLGERAWNDRYARPQWGLGGGKFLGGA